MRVADVHPGHPEFLAAERENLVDGGQPRLAHPDLDEARGRVEHPDRGRARDGAQHEPVRVVVVLGQVEREHPEPVAALLAFAAVGVEDPQPHRFPSLERADRVDRTEQHAVGTDPEVPVAHQPHGFRRRREGGFPRIDHQVVVAQRLVLDEVHG